MLKKKLRIAINAQLTPESGTGGIVSVLRALARVTELDGPEEYVFVGPYDDPEWLRPLLSGQQSIVRGPNPRPAEKQDTQDDAARGRLFARRLGRMFGIRSESESERPGLSGSKFFESLNCDVVHFPFQTFEKCSVPTIFNPHDLQHVHFREFFSPADIVRREQLYPMACRAAHTVVVASNFVKDDVVEHFSLDPRKVQVIPWAPPPLVQSSHQAEGKTDLEVARKYGLVNGPFALYPAMTWEHKNHIRLLEAVAQLRDHDGLALQVVCTGFKTDFWPQIEKRLHEMKLQELVKFPGLIPVEDLNALYRSAQFVIVPTLYEAASAPVFEAWQHGVAVACSRVNGLPEQAGVGALLFDPMSVSEIKSALRRLGDDRFCEDLRLRGSRRLSEFSWERTAKSYRAVYRRAAGQKLNDEDRWLLASDVQSKSETEIEALQA